MKRLLEFFQDSTGALSSMRLAFLVWFLGTFIVWTVLSIEAKAPVALPKEVLLILGSLTTGKVMQSITDNHENTPNDPPKQ